jgi:hypothetical protein
MYGVYNVIMSTFVEGYKIKIIYVGIKVIYMLDCPLVG